MREIKFRAWVTDEKVKGVMVNVTDICFMQEYEDGADETTYVAASEGWYGDNRRIRFSLSNAALMQFTGLKDKKGKEIYEGDIVQSPYDSKGNKIKAVEWRDSYNQCGWNLRKDTGVEIIGNIYENPELVGNG
jgi:uncharacterized phage protein (TIGR01671 family)